MQMIRNMTNLANAKGEILIGAYKLQDKKINYQSNNSLYLHDATLYHISLEKKIISMQLIIFFVVYSTV